MLRGHGGGVGCTYISWGILLQALVGRQRQLRRQFQTRVGFVILPFIIVVMIGLKQVVLAAGFLGLSLASPLKNRQGNGDGCTICVDNANDCGKYVSSQTLCGRHCVPVDLMADSPPLLPVCTAAAGISAKRPVKNSPSRLATASAARRKCASTSAATVGRLLVAVTLLGALFLSSRSPNVTM